MLNRGMNRDLSISKVGESCVYENHNIRITAENQDTLISVTNERGTKSIATITGTFVGANILNQYLIVFTASNGADKIYVFDTSSSPWGGGPIYTGNLGFSTSHPIESICYYETEDIQKVYWVDGIHVLRCCNIKQTYSGSGDIFDVNKSVSFLTDVTITKTNSGNARPNGVIQYMVSYYNKHGQETGFVYISDLVYLSPTEIGGSADGTNSNVVKLQIGANAMDTSFDYMRVYSVFRSSLDGQVTVGLIDEVKTTSGSVTIVDDGAHFEAVDVTKLLYLGSDSVKPNTITQKDNTLFLGNFESVGRSSAADLESTIDSTMRSGSTSSCITFSRTPITGAESIDYTTNNGLYPYNNQLDNTSSKVLSFKGNEKYRFGIRFQYGDGKVTDTYWIGDATNILYPTFDSTNGKINRIVGKIDSMPGSLTSFLTANGYKTFQIMIAEATDADRSVKAQGIINPTVFNAWERYNNRVYAMPSWSTRPKRNNIEWNHFVSTGEPVNSTCEVQCGINTFDGAGFAAYIRNETYPGEAGVDYIMAVYRFSADNEMWGMRQYSAVVTVVRAINVASGRDNLVKEFDYSSVSAGDWVEVTGSDFTGGRVFRYTQPDGYFTLERREYYTITESAAQHSDKELYSMLKNILSNYGDWVGVAEISQESVTENCEAALSQGAAQYINLYYGSTTRFSTKNAAMDAGSTASQKEERWHDTSQPSSGAGSNKAYDAAYNRKNQMYIDENVLTIDSPEIYYGSSVVDNTQYNFRYVGVAFMDGVTADYTVDATKSYISGDSLVRANLSARTGIGTSGGIYSWPLWMDYSLHLKPDVTTEVEKRTSDDYYQETNTVYYWLYMWQHSGNITCYQKEAGDISHGNVTRKVFANRTCSYSTVYFSNPVSETISPVRIASDVSSNQIEIQVGNETKVYSPRPVLQLTMPGMEKYPIIYSDRLPSGTSTTSDLSYLYSGDPVTIEYSTNKHAVFSLETIETSGAYVQQILPYLGSNTGSDYARYTPAYNPSDTIYIPWITNPDSHSYAAMMPILSSVTRNDTGGTFPGNGLPYCYIGELYRVFGSGNADTRYGGPTKEAAENCRYIAASRWYPANTSSGIVIDRGDTYIQRWDALRTKPYSNGSVNNVVDIASVMLETHINIDGRTDLQRGISELASIDVAQFNSINPVYSQKDNYLSGRDLDEDANTDKYQTGILWTLPKKNLADTDEWMHINTANTILLDGDKGPCQALRRFNNSIIAFQDRGISEVLFNSRTQLSTQDGVPVEIANSGKVDGVRYITNKYGCINKWSITEGKLGLYFIDNINQSICAFNGSGIDNLSERLGFGVFMRSRNSVEPWTPATFGNYVSFFDKIKDDVYFIKSETLPNGVTDDCAALVYNERLGRFTSFFDYGGVSYMTNTYKNLISIKGNGIWSMNTGLYGSFFGSQSLKDYWVTYRVAPDMQRDKIWTNVDLRADFFNILNNSGTMIISESELIDGGNDMGYTSKYVANEHFTRLNIWNEYQRVSVDDTSTYNPVKRFRIWRYIIPRDMSNSAGNGIDRIRNPWIFLKFTKTLTNDSAKYLMQLHDAEVTFFE